MYAGAWFGGPSATEIERQRIRWLAEMIGYPTDCGGVLTSGGTMANQPAIYTALQSATDFEARASGLHAADRAGRFTLYESAHEAHSSVTRVAETLGLGSDAIRSVPCDDDYRMDPDALSHMLNRADSVTLDPHKWLSVPYSCGCVLFRDSDLQSRAFSS